MNKVHRKLVSWFLSILAIILAVTARAGSVTNNFTTAADYVVNGIIGDTFWDGVYLGFGDIPNGGPGGSGNGSTLQANTAISGFLGIQTIGSDWAGNGDDGFYLWKHVAGDFDVSVQSSPVWTDQGNNFGGLLVRAYNTNYSGAPVSFSSTNRSENYLELWRDQQFSGSQIRQTTNGTDIQDSITDPAGPTDTNTTRYYRITRTGDTFTFYWKTNQTDAWFLITNAGAGAGYVATNGTISRPDWDGQPVQVGIAQAIFARPALPAVDYFTDFELSGTNVGAAPSMPAGPTNLVTSAPNTNGSLTFSWNTNGGNGSILIIRRIHPANSVLIANPIQGVDYTTFANTNWAAPSNLIAGATHVVYAGSATNVTVSGLGGSNNVYLAEILSYDSVSGPSVVYNTASPATTSFLGPGLPASISVNVFPTTLPVGGAGRVQVIATFSTGEQVDVTTDPSVSVVSGDSTIVSITSGILNALLTGTTTLTTTYASFAVTNGVTNVPPRFTDNFSTPHNYLVNGLPGSGWDGIYLAPGDLEGGTGTGGATALATAVDADISSNNTLTVTAGGTYWEGANDSGFYIFKTITGDFQAVVHVDLTNHGAYQFAGIIARTANANGSPFTAGENVVANWFFDQFGVLTSARQTINGVYQGANDNGGGPDNTQWLLLQRVNSTNFYCYNKLNLTDPWSLAANASLVEPTMSNGVPVQVGLAQSTYTGGPAETVRFDSFMLDGPGLFAVPAVPIPPAVSNFTMTFNPDTSMTLRWFDPIADDGTAPAVARAFVVMRAGEPVSAQPALADGLAGNSIFGDPANDMGGHNYVVYRTGSGDTNQNQHVTVTGLKPGVIYYAAVYTFSSLGASRTFNTAITSSTNLQDGVLLGIQASLLGNGVPAGGVGFVQTIGTFTGGGLADISSAVTITPLNTNFIVATNGVLTGVTNGSTTVQVTINGFTNNLAVTVRNPSFADNFGVSHDYVASGVTGTGWDGIYDQPSNAIPDQTFASTASTTSADANISSNNCLTVTNLNAGFEFNQDDGFFLFKYVPADFQMAVNLQIYTNNGSEPYNCSGLLARAYTIATNGSLGAPLDLAGNECWIAWERFDEFGNGTRYEYTVDNGTARPNNTDVNSPEHYMLMVRQNSTNFYFFQRTRPTDPWHTTGIGNRAGANAGTKFAGLPLQVGPMISGFDSGTPVNVSFSNFMLDIGSPRLSITSSGSNIIVSWPGSPSAQLQSTTTLHPTNWQPVAGTPTFANGQYSLTLPASDGGQFFRLKD
jgi:hypothetical protein